MWISRYRTKYKMISETIGPWATYLTWGNKSTNPYDYIITLIRRRKKLSSFWKWMVPYLNELVSTSSKGALCQVWLKLDPWFWRGRFLNIINVFSLFRNYLPWKWVWNFFTQDCLLASVVQIGTVVLEKKIFFNFVNIFSLFCNYLPMEKGDTLHLNKLESPSPKDVLCQVSLKLVQ